MTSDRWPVIDYINGGFMHGFVRSYEILSGLVKPDTLVVPANGPVITGADVVKMKDLYWELFKQFFVLFNKGLGPRDVAEFNAGKEFKGVVPIVADRPLTGNPILQQLGDPSQFLEFAYRSTAAGDASSLVQLKIDFVSDVACPWCAIGLASLEEALRRLAGVVEADITFQPFELNPDMPAPGVNHDEHIAGKYGMPPEQFAASRQMLRQRAAGVGFEINSNAQSRIYNTFDAHRLLHLAKAHGRQHELKRALFKANFTDNRNVSDPDELAAIAAAAGLDAGEARRLLASQQYAQEVRQAEQSWMARGIQAVPGVVINGKWLISGGQTPDVFEQALRNIAAT